MAHGPPGKRGEDPWRVILSFRRESLPVFLSFREV